MVLWILGALRWLLRRWATYRSTWVRRKVARALRLPLFGDRLCILERPRKYPWFFVTTACHYFHILRPRQCCWHIQPRSGAWARQLNAMGRRNVR